MQQVCQEAVAEDTDGNDLRGRDLGSPEKLSLQSKKLQKLRKAYEKRGIVYVSRIPPHMVFQSVWAHRCCLNFCMNPHSN